ncbi:MAG: hypothetical protein ACRCX7_07285, partial [Cetobacterium sp.]|uniref:hypothetical protein n=1 Tax=Cetobacterium sp. TaxID=2071632 RepID=UPI003F33696C
MIRLQNRFSVLGDQQNTENGENTHTSLDRDNILDKTLTKTYFKFIQATHHMETVDHSVQTGNFPTGMCRQVDKLTKFIKPSSPIDTTTEKIAQNTHNWMQTNMNILQEHYTHTIISLMEQITKFSDLEWTVAMRWAKNRFKQKLRESTLSYCKETIKGKEHNCLNTAGPLTYATVLQKASPPQAQIKQLPQNLTQTRTSQGPSQKSLSISPFTAVKSRNQHKQEIVVQAQVHHREVSPEPRNKIRLEEVRAINSPGFSRSRKTTMSEEEGTDGVTVQQRGIGMMGQDKELESQEVTRSESLHSDSATVVKPSTVSSDSSDGEILDTVSLGNTPYRHINTERKAIDWSINIHKPIVFIGDSNLSRIPKIGNREVQVDSFPGANFRHISIILEKLSTHPHTQKV